MTSLVGAYVGNVASNWISTTVEGAKDAASAYGGNLAGDVIIAGGNLVENAGRSVGDKVSGYAARYGTWVNGYGDKLRGAPGSSLPKSGPLAVYKAGGMGSGTLKRSASYGPSASSSKALMKPVTTIANTSKKRTQYPIGAIKPYSTFVKDKPKEKEKETALSKTGNPKYPISIAKAMQPSKPTHSKPPSSLHQVNSFPAMNSNPKMRASIAPDKTPKTDNSNKRGSTFPEKNSTTSNPRARASIVPDKAPTKTANNKYPSGPKSTASKTTEKPYGLTSKAAGGGHIPLTGFGGGGEKENGGPKGYKPYTPPSKGPEGNASSKVGQQDFNGQQASNELQALNGWGCRRRGWKYW
ncbi:hypothetical protein NA57DRAFT_57917 [Rhizodiscina lignyota]|uniref:Uncharacterized protein n=1 Tax=Rhizodiscina lignyota TaxID=1504668 RepID=A0A9P4I967_9PEZI|nr:hypothetical protein NA57DRAFT_57917 [Rhizodiscina lignyota]